jgi:outer membrane lipoprotein-sorting protein
MKRYTLRISIMKKQLLSLLIWSFSLAAFGQNATEIVRKSEAYLRGAQSTAQASITTVRPRWTRTMDVTFWNKGTDKSMLLITGPEREKGTAFLKNGAEVWNYVPAIKKLVALPAALMQNWMGTDISNDALINAGSLTTDYIPSVVGEAVLEGKSCYIIELVPKKEAAVVWGLVRMHITKDSYIQLKGEFYDEDEFLITSMVASDLKKFDGRLLPSKIRMIPAEDPDSYTEIIYHNVDFHTPIPDSFFTKESMKNL